MTAINFRSWIKNLLLLILSFCFSLFLAESLLRVTVAPVNYLRPKVVPDDILNHKIPPYSGGHDAWGFRNPSVPTTADIVTIGDSMTYGTLATATHSWPSRLQTYTGMAVYNLGLGAYGPAQYLYLLEHKALSLKPSLVIVGLYFGNDFYNAYEITYKYDYWRFLRNPDATDPTAKEIQSTVIYTTKKKTLFQKARSYMRRNVILTQVAS
ncbi:MAG: hypothetical protein ETSY1_37490, partial [Candidatus Entotheonella factor]